MSSPARGQEEQTQPSGNSAIEKSAEWKERKIFLYTAKSAVGKEETVSQTKTKRMCCQQSHLIRDVMSSSEEGHSDPSERRPGRRNSEGKMKTLFFLFLI